MATSGSGADRLRTDPDILIIEPFYCGSHRQLVDCLMRDEVIGPRVHLVTMSGKKWHWRARVSALHLSTAIPVHHHFRVLFSSSVLNLAELVALRKDLASLHKVLYFHENQLQYPVRKQKDRDFQYGYNQILSCIVADCVLFNSGFNMESFLTSINSFLKLMPDYRPSGLADTLRPKCSVVYFPMQYPNSSQSQVNSGGQHLKITPNVKISSTGRAYDSKQKADETGCLVTSDMQPMQTDDNHFVSQTRLEDYSCVSDMHGIQMHCSQDIKSETDTRDCGESIELHSQPKVGRLDTLLKTETTENDCGLKSHVTKRGACDSGRLFHQTDNHTVVLPGSCEHHVPNDESSAFHAHSSGRMTQMNSIHQKTAVHQYKKEDRASLCKTVGTCDQGKDERLHIVWPHRWEHDKDPETFFQVLFRLQDEGHQFLISIFGETFTDVPEIFGKAEQRLKGHIYRWGYQPDKSDYYHTLQHAHVVVSTSKHEFFGVAMLEAVCLGCYPLCPKSLVYPEIYPGECLYSTPNQLYKRLRSFCQHPHLARHSSLQIDVQKFSWDNLRPVYMSKLLINS